MPHPTTIEFWFEFASTYSYLAAMRAETVVEAAGLRLRWRPFLLGPIFRAQGWNDSPFNVYPAKGRYMWRDLERLCAKADLPFRRPTQFPRNGLAAARIAVLGSDTPWGPAFVRGVYHLNFGVDQDIADEELLAGLLENLGLDGEAICARARAVDNKERLRQQTEEAVRLGIFGAPTFVVGNELFWGNDRLEDAVSWGLSSAA